jgi:hypothetical protein
VVGDGESVPSIYWASSRSIQLVANATNARASSSSAVQHPTGTNTRALLIKEVDEDLAEVVTMVPGSDPVAVVEAGHNDLTRVGP